MPASAPAAGQSLRAGSSFLHLLLAATVLGAVWVTYAPTLDDPFQFDDELFLNDSNVRGGNWQELLLPPVPRAFTWLAFLVQLQTFGGAPFGFHLVSLLLHLANTVLAALLLRQILESQVEPAWGWAWAGAAIFALHPVQVESVAYVYQQSTLMAALLALAATLLWFRRGETTSIRLGGILCLLYLGALGFKENVVLVPLLWWFSDGSTGKGASPNRALWPSLAVMAAAVAILPFWLRASDPTLTLTVSDSLRYLSAQLTVFWRYLAILAGLAPLNLDHDVQPLSPESVRYWFAAAGIAALTAIAYFLLRRRPGSSRLAALTLLLLLPTSSIIPSHDLMFEHRLYAAMVGIAGLAVMILIPISARADRAWEISRRRFPEWGRSGVQLILVVLLAGVLSVWSRGRVEFWRDPITLWTDTLSKSPNKYRPNFNLGVLLMRETPAHARQLLQRAAQINPASAQAYQSLGQLELETQNLELARRYWETALQLEPGSAETHAALGQLLVEENQYAVARKHLEHALELDPSLSAPYYHLSLLELKFGFSSASIEWAERGLQGHPDDAQLWMVLGLAVSEQQNWARAVELFQEALARDPGLEAARAGLARAQAQRQ